MEAALSAASDDGGSTDVDVALCDGGGLFGGRHGCVLAVQESASVMSMGSSASSGEKFAGDQGESGSISYSSRVAESESESVSGKWGGGGEELRAFLLRCGEGESSFAG